MSDQFQNQISIGEPLDQLFNSACKYPFQGEMTEGSEKSGDAGGLVRITNGKQGSGNIVIAGGAGTGKSTLALQIACEAVRRNKNTYAAYFSLEEGQAQILNKARMFGWKDYVKPVSRLWGPDEVRDGDSLARLLNETLTEPHVCLKTGMPIVENGGNHEDCENEDICGGKPFNSERIECKFTKKPGLVIVPQLMPRAFGVESCNGKKDELFWSRFRQLDLFLQAAEQLRNMSDTAPRLDIVCVDSLNVLGTGGLTRDHLAALFDLFQRRKIIGVFTVEENERGIFASDSELDVETIEFLCDVVVKLTNREEHGYWLSHFQITKSRHQKQALGRHPYKIVGYRKGQDEAKVRSLLPVSDEKEMRYVSKKWSRLVREGGSIDQKYLQWRDFLVRIDKTTNKPLNKYQVDKEIENLINTWKHLVDNEDKELEKRERLRRSEAMTGVCVFPSVHAIILASENVKRQEKSDDDRKKYCSSTFESFSNSFKKKTPYSYFVPVWSSSTLDSHLLPAGGHVKPQDIFTLVGPKATGKKLLAENYLLTGLIHGEDVLCIRLSETTGKPIEGSWAWKNDNELKLTKKDVISAEYEYKQLEGSLNEYSSDTEKEKFSKAKKKYIKIKTEYEDNCRKKQGLSLKSDKLVDENRSAWLRVFRSSDMDDTNADDKKGYHRQICGIQELSPRARELVRLLGCLKTSKVQFALTEYHRPIDDTAKLEDVKCPIMVELALKPGAVLPEEALQAIRAVYRWSRDSRGRTRGIWRAVLTDVSAIGVGYPLLRESSTAADLFLSALVHIFRCRGTGLMMTGIRGGQPESEAVVKRACALADVVIETNHCDVFGDRYITMSGPAQLEEDDERGHECTPGVLKRHIGKVNGKEKALGFWLDTQVLAGLVGFSTGNIRRPGVSVHLFEEGVVHEAYNEKVGKMLSAALATHFIRGDFRKDDDEAPGIRSEGEVEVLPFNSLDSAALHDSRSILGNKPLHRTVVRSIDEFAHIRSKDNSEGMKSTPYYRNLLLIAYRGLESSKIMSWEEMAKLDKNDVTILLDTRAEETLACVALDCYLQNEPRINDGKPIQLSQNKNVNFSEQIRYAVKVLSRAKPLLGADPESLSIEMKKVISKRKKIICLCWYSHVREVMRLAERVYGVKESWSDDLKPDNGNLRSFISELKVKALPNCGFKGDWFLECASGSVSPALGDRIMEVLGSPEENFKRFVQGVGLPSEIEENTSSTPSDWKSQNLMAWPGASVSLKTVLGMHEEARKRSEVEFYPEMRARFFHIMRMALEAKGKERKLLTPPLVDEEAQKDVATLIEEAIKWAEDHGNIKKRIIGDKT